jgi:predicted flap endonuclease-1-like 5' DNA nuclease
MGTLLLAGWHWFAIALAIGLAVGFFSATRSAGAMSGRWVLVLGALLLGAGAIVSLGRMVPGRQGLLVDIGLLATLAYAFGLPVGGVLKGSGPAPLAAPRKPPPVVVVRGPVRESVAAEPLPTQQLVALAEPPEAPQSEEAQPAAPVAASVAPDAKKHPGQRPETLAQPHGAPDDLGKIKGVGPKSVEKLHALGVFHYDQIAGWTLDNARWIGAAIGAPGRVERGKWIQQARDLVEQAKGGRQA